MTPDRARAYDRWYNTGLGAAAHRIELALLAAAARPRAGERAVDIGCGTGMLASQLAEQGLVVTGLDRDPAMLEAARARVPAATLVDGDATALPFPDGAFDLALAVTLFCFLDASQRRAAAAEMLRVVRPGRRIVIGELARASLWAAQRRVRGWLGTVAARPLHHTARTADAPRRGRRATRRDALRALSATMGRGGPYQSSRRLRACRPPPRHPRRLVRGGAWRARALPVPGPAHGGCDHLDHPATPASRAVSTDLKEEP